MHGGTHQGTLSVNQAVYSVSFGDDSFVYIALLRTEAVVFENFWKGHTRHICKARESIRLGRAHSVTVHSRDVHNTLFVPPTSAWIPIL